jgi:hypothetical protein
MEYRRIRTRVVVLALLVTAFLGGACQYAAGNSFTFPLLLWWIPGVLLEAVGLGIATVLVARFKRFRQHQREGE